MAKKIDKATAERAAALGIKKVKDEEELRDKLLAILAENDIDGMEDEDTDSLFDMVESMVGGDDEPEDDEESEADELAEEVEDEEDDEVEDEEDDEVEEAEDEEAAPKKAEKKAAKTVKAEKKQPADKKAEKSEKAEKKASKRGVKLDPKGNKDDRKPFKFLEKFFPTDKYEYCWLVMNGLTVKFKGSNSNRAVFSLESCTQTADGTIRCNAYFLTFSKSLDVLDEAGIDYNIGWNQVPFMKSISFEELEEIIETLLPSMEKFVEKIDKRLGDNRKKMEESLKKTTKKDKSAVKKSAKVEEPEEVDDEVEDEEPAPKKPAKKPAKKGKK